MFNKVVAMFRLQRQSPLVPSSTSLIDNSATTDLCAITCHVPAEMQESTESAIPFLNENERLMMDDVMSVKFIRVVNKPFSEQC